MKKKMKEVSPENQKILKTGAKEFEKNTLKESWLEEKKEKPTPKERSKLQKSSNKKRILLFIFLTLIMFIYIYYIRTLSDDELFNYGFAVNIINGLIPYKDFNMIIPPLFHYLLAIILKIFGQKLFVYHFTLALMISIITILSYKKLGLCAFIIPLILLSYPYTGYNIFCVFLLFLLITKKEGKYSNILEPILIVMMILTKQTLALLAIPNIFQSKNKKKTFLIYLISGLIFLIYLLINNNLLEFVDYCFLGMFNFTEKNNTGLDIFLFLEIGIIITLICLYIKDKEKSTLYVLLFQIMAFPIVDYYHMVISLAPATYIFLSKVNHNRILVHFALTLAISFFLFFNLSNFMRTDNYKYMSHYDMNNFMKDRMTFSLMENMVLTAKENLEKYSEHTPYFFGYFAYLIKLTYDIPINKYDLINNGNMGYGGYQKYIEEIDEHCQKNKCIFFVSEMEVTKQLDTQTNKEILKYVIKNYQKVSVNSTFGVYIN